MGFCLLGNVPIACCHAMENYGLKRFVTGPFFDLLISGTRVTAFGKCQTLRCAAWSKYVFFRILVVDWDIHHGNGTQETFYNDAR